MQDSDLSPTVKEQEGDHTPPPPSEAISNAPESAEAVGRGGLRGEAPPPRGTKKQVAASTPRLQLTVEQRILILDAWRRSGLPATDFAPLVGVSHHTLYKWKRDFDKYGPAGLTERPKKKLKQQSRLPEATQRAILMMKESHPDWGCDRIHDMLARIDGYSASPGAILRVLRDAGYETVEVVGRNHPDKVRRFERARPNQLWQSDLFTFILKRENRRVHLVVYLDDHSRFIVGHGLHASSSGAMVREVLESAIANYGAPEEVLTDHGTQYVTWRGKSAFAKLLERRGIKHIVARPRHPQTLGKTERFWGTLWRECVEQAIFQGIDDARRRIGHFVDYYNFQRTHQGIDGHVPADRYFSAAPEVRKALEARVAANAVDLAVHGIPRKTVYLAGRVGDESIALHGEGDRVILTKEDGTREEVDLKATGRRAGPDEPAEMPEPVSASAVGPDPTDPETEEEPPPPGTSSLDEGLRRLADES